MTQGVFIVKNRAKCKLCKDIIESFNEGDFVPCKCGEIYVNGGLKLLCGASNWNNFLRVDDQGNEIIVSVKEDQEEKTDNYSNKPSKNEQIEMLDSMLKKIEELPPQAMQTYVSHYDLYSFMLVVSSILKDGIDCKPSN